MVKLKTEATEDVLLPHWACGDRWQGGGDCCKRKELHGKLVSSQLDRAGV